MFSTRTRACTFELITTVEILQINIHDDFDYNKQPISAAVAATVVAICPESGLRL